MKEGDKRLSKKRIRIAKAGANLFSKKGFAETSMEELTRRLGPYLIVMFCGMLVVTFVPWFSLVIPRMLHMAN